MKRASISAALLLALLFLIAPLPANAACQTISVTNLVFGNYTGSALSFTASVTAHCDNGYGYSIGLDVGNSGDASDRTMTSGSNALHYQMYSDAAHTSYWGPDPGTNYVNKAGTGANQTFTIYGLLPAGQWVVPGSYADGMIIYLYNTGLYVGINITATVVATCTVSAGALTFGNYTGTLIDFSSPITVTCTNTTTFNIGLNAGTGTGATVSNRKMTSPASTTLNYLIFRDSARTVNWGNTPGTDTLVSNGNGTPQSVGAFGRLPAGQYVNPAVYSDTITATVTY